MCPEVDMEFQNQNAKKDVVLLFEIFICQSRSEGYVYELHSEPKDRGETPDRFELAINLGGLG